jgi:choline monooxygenase
MANGTTHPADLAPQPLETARALPAACYVDPSYAVLDAQRILARSWQLVAHADLLRSTGDHVVCEIAGVPLVVVRGDDGALRALHNVCRHRAGPLATCNGRGVRELVCKYHGWRYALDGRLRGAPEMGRVQDFRVDAVCLPQARVDEWQGLVFVALTDDVPPLASVVDGIEERLGLAHRLSQYRHHAHLAYEIGCNWKVYVDNYLEGYHVPQVHPALNAALDYRSYTTDLSNWHVLQSSPLDTAESLYGRGEALYYWLWPNTMLNCLPGRLQTNRVVPLGASRCRVEFDFFYAPGEEHRAAADAKFSDEVQQEDITICEAVQRGLASGSYTPGRLNPVRESGVWMFQELVREAYRTG